MKKPWCGLDQCKPCQECTGLGAACSDRYFLESNTGADVAVGLIEKRDNPELFLVQWRPMSKPSGGYPGWLEFPGGKVDKGESSVVALIREVHQEVGITVQAANHICTMEDTFPSGLEHKVHFYVITSGFYTGEPHGAESQRIGWMTLYQIMTFHRMLPLNRAAALILTTERHPDILE
jgi:8-oxo-dGTP diphosphatase